MHNLPINSQAVSGLQSCFTCCQNPAAALVGGPNCTATDAQGLPLIYNFVGNTSSTDGYINCLASCQTLHGSIESFSGAETGSIFPPAYSQFQTVCAALTGQAAAAVPPLATLDTGDQVRASLTNPPGGGAPAQVRALQVVSALVGSKKAMAERYLGDVLVSWRAMVVCGESLRSLTPADTSPLSKPATPPSSPHTYPQKSHLNQTSAPFLSRALPTCRCVFPGAHPAEIHGAFIHNCL